VIARLEEQNRQVWQAFTQKMKHDDVFGLKTAREADRPRARLVQDGAHQSSCILVFCGFGLECSEHINPPFPKRTADVEFAAIPRAKRFLLPLRRL
jgi:hypothetical protein